MPNETMKPGAFGKPSPSSGWLAGMSLFRKEGTKIIRVSNSALGPHVDFSAVWHLLDMQPCGAGGWTSKFNFKVGG